ncbi:Potassium transporter 1 [Monoraphidium neglectum]|uniref:Potassium transporter 1 n=1 Tax=Monoraphidium neglectum TaxID=145388 RepID=A0A0D2LFF2_9CHLO|nr:Potassium transporter 1 [Monoraphidium neglectum]KIZ05369.1 Potassium transporter 1 [Monoraphidium neglectum]|eukprot:XP_013904388.1 Potassium transporter 1 [Monoraphidium neglectum]
MAAVKPSDSKGSAYAGPARRGLLALSFGALGVIYGDIGTSPLYAYQSVFTAPPSREETLSAASLFFWTLTLIVLVKYVGIILRFDDNGEGGTFALYSLICRAAGFGPYGPSQPVDMHFLTGGAGALASRLPRGATRGHWWSLQTGLGGRVRAWYRRSQAGQVALLVVVMLATAMVIGDGVLTPSISVLSAISGLKVATDQITQSTVVGISIAVLVLLFAVQRAGTGKISVVFAPVVTVWLLFNASLGFYNLSTNGWGIWEAINPAYIFTAFTGPGGFDAGWRLLAGVMLCITGAEAMYADLGHFNAAAVMLSFSGFVYPCLVVTYMGQAAYIIGHPDAYEDPFWNSVPHGAFWPMLVVATLTSGAPRAA